MWGLDTQLALPQVELDSLALRLAWVDALGSDLRSLPVVTYFHDLGAVFPLFNARVEEASEYVGIADCSITRAEAVPCFRLGVGCHLVVRCLACGADNGLDADDRDAEVCHRCAELVEFPRGMPDEIVVCYAALRAGRAAISKDTEYGMITWESAQCGLTEGPPGGGRSRQSSRAPLSALCEDRAGTKLDPEVMLELLRTPTYISWQGERWLFEGRTPGVFIGCWDAADFAAHAGSQSAEDLFFAVVGSSERWLWSALGAGRISVYVFRMPGSGDLRAHWDMD